MAQKNEVWHDGLSYYYYNYQFNMQLYIKKFNNENVI